MGGTKKPTPASKDKSTSSKRDKKDKGDSSPRKAEITVRVNEQQALKIIGNSKVITVQELARQLGIKVSAANTFLKEAVSKDVIKRVGGYSGHYLYQSISKSTNKKIVGAEKDNDQKDAIVTKNTKKSKVD